MCGFEVSFLVFSMDPQHVLMKTVWHLFQFEKAELQRTHFPCARLPLFCITCQKKYNSVFHDGMIFCETIRE